MAIMSVLITAVKPRPKNKTFLAWANYRINLPFGTYNRRGMFIPAYIYPTVIIALGVVILITIMLKFTKFGRNLYAIGGNQQSAVKPRPKNIPANVTKNGWISRYVTK